MADQKTRTMRIDSVDESGVFQMTLATEGEASDGDILSIKGGQIPDRMPLLQSHYNDLTMRLGSVTNPVKLLKEKPPALRATGHIEFGGEEPQAAIRRDIAHMINRHGGAVSIRWTDVEGGKPPIRRVNLPSDHPYFVADDDPSERKRWGLFWPEWKALEGSVVALGADPGALIDGKIYRARAEETTGAVSDFWRSLAEDAEKPPQEAPEECERAEETLEEEPSDLPEVPIDLELEARVRADPEPESEEPEGETPDPLAAVIERLDALSGQVADLASCVQSATEEQERVRAGDPLPPTDPLHPQAGDSEEPTVMRPREFFALLGQELAEARSRVVQQFRADIKKARGEID